MVPKFTERGFDVVDTPPEIQEKLLAAVNEGLLNWDNLPYEGESAGIYGPSRAKFIDMQDVAWEVIEELREYHEDWVGGMALEPTSSYGVRMYQNGASLVMHHDKVHTHVISSIVHITHK